MIFLYFKNKIILCLKFMYSFIYIIGVVMRNKVLSPISILLRVVVHSNYSQKLPRRKSAENCGKSEAFFLGERKEWIIGRKLGRNFPRDFPFRCRYVPTFNSTSVRFSTMYNSPLLSVSIV